VAKSESRPLPASPLTDQGGEGNDQDLIAILREGLTRLSERVADLEATVAEERAARLCRDRKQAKSLAVESGPGLVEMLKAIQIGIEENSPVSNWRGDNRCIVAPPEEP
jgi:hypothetical protein